MTRWPILVHTRRFPPRGYRAITLFPVVFFRGNALSPSEVRHETIHLWQQAALLVLPFYVLYLLFWIVGLLRYRSWDRAYRAIPFERSAYSLESVERPRRTTMAFHWVRCLVGAKP